MKILCSINALPEAYKKQLNRSQVSRYRKINHEIFFGHELSNHIEKELAFIRQLGDFPNAKKICRSILKLFLFFRSITCKLKGFHTVLKERKFLIADLVQCMQAFVPIKLSARLLGLHPSTIHNWIRQERVKCSESIIHLCRKAHPLQLLTSEVSKMKALLTNQTFRYWPLRSLYYYSLKNKITCMAESTWYRYASLLNINRLKPKSVKKWPVGIRASGPNQLWHADVTYQKTADGMRHYIYTIIDNYSRFPLAVELSTKLCGKFRVQTFRTALKKAIEIDPSIQNIQLMIDGGSENFNINVDTFLKETETIEIKRIRALRDGLPSNSMVEAFHKIMKTNYLNHLPLENTADLNKALDFLVNDYAYKRPHGILKGLTPYEAQRGQKPYELSYRPQLLAARKMRIAENKNFKCPLRCPTNRSK